MQTTNLNMIRAALGGYEATHYKLPSFILMSNDVFSAIKVECATMASKPLEYDPNRPMRLYGIEVGQIVGVGRVVLVNEN